MFCHFVAAKRTIRGDRCAMHLPAKRTSNGDRCGRGDVCFFWTSARIRGCTGVRNPFLACRAPVAPLLWPPVMPWEVVYPSAGHEHFRGQQGVLTPFCPVNMLYLNWYEFRTLHVGS